VTTYLAGQADDLGRYAGALQEGPGEGPRAGGFPIVALILLVIFGLTRRRGACRWRSASSA